MTDQTRSRQTRRFSARAFIAMMVALTGAALPPSGWANHLLQTELTTRRHAWMGAHVSLGCLFVIFATWHIVLNWRPLLRHARGLGRRLPPISREMLYALALVTVTTFLAAGHAFLVR